MYNAVARSINWPNTLTVARIGIAFATFQILLSATFFTSIIGGILLTVAAVTDFVDGKMARDYGMVTTFGKILDPIADKILVLGTFVVFSWLDVFPLWITFSIFVREILITVLRMYFLTQGVAVAAVKSGKQKTMVQLAAIVFMYATFLFTNYFTASFSPSVSTIVGNTLATLMYIALLLAVWISLSSGVDFFRNNWTMLKEQFS